ncbi:MAG: alpha/beta hydrolase-fold protein [Bacteroidia bacterium]
MKKLIPLLLVLAFASCKKEEFSPTLTKEFSIQSVSNGANYNIKVGLPDNYNASSKYATIYVLDGEEDFDFVAKKCNEFSDDYSKTNILVVSIGYGNDRALDYTPTDVAEGDGGAEKFMLFIKNELIPKMETDFGADTLRENRIILGHSFGGLFAVYAFTKFNNVFGNYIMLSPSIWYDNEVVLRYEQENRDLNKNNSQFVFMGLGQLENEGRMLAPYMAFYQRLNNNYPYMQIVSHLQPHLDHLGSKNPNIEEALKFYFKNK